MELNKYLEKWLLDYRISLNHIRVLNVAFNNKYVCVNDCTSKYRFRQPYVSRLMHELVDYGYLKKEYRDIDTAKIYYSLIREEAF